MAMAVFIGPCFSIALCELPAPATLPMAWLKAMNMKIPDMMNIRKSPRIGERRTPKIQYIARNPTIITSDCSTVMPMLISALE